MAPISVQNSDTFHIIFIPSTKMYCCHDTINTIKAHSLYSSHQVALPSRLQSFIAALIEALCGLSIRSHREIEDAPLEEICILYAQVGERLAVEFYPFHVGGGGGVAFR
mmetsp:Transcript_10165/g.12122  ORF Transcript_10165/g.12122 Transcript_10165/m.12122 type:complete len:109 (-) Transcript_10165:2372-2698(-)